MSDAEWIKLFAACGLSGMVCLSVLAWKGMSVLSMLTGKNLRASETERQGWFEMIQRAVERRDHPNGDTLRMHASERMEQARLRAGVERADLDTNGTATRMDAPTVYGETYDAVNE